MNYIDTINGYRIYEYTKETCKKYGVEFPTVGAFLCDDEIPNPINVECEMETFEELAEWCENN